MSVSSITIKALKRSVRRVLAQFKSKKPMSAVEWADQYFYLSPESSYVACWWKTHPVQIAPLNSMGSDDIHEVYNFKGARVGSTKMMMAAKLYLIEHKRRNIGFYREDDTAIKKYVDVELDPALRDSPPFKKIFPSLGKRGPGNTTNLKSFIGAALRCLGGQAAGNFRGDSLDAVFGDEVDAFVSNVQGKSSKEGDPFVLMYKRTNGSPFPMRRMGSTPTKDGASHIQRLSRRAKIHLRFHIPCPHCGEEQHLEWTSKTATYGFKWQNSDPMTVGYQCRACGESFKYEDYLDLAKQGIWKDPDTGVWTRNGLDFFDASNQPLKVRRVAYYMPGYLSPTDPWSNMIERWYDQKDDPNTRQGFINTDLGQVYIEETGEKLDHQRLLDRREKPWKEVPMGGLYLTSFTDVQTAGRLETLVVAHGLNGECWALEHVIHPGDPAQPAVWDTLEQYLRRPWKHASGLELRISRGGVDTGGHYFDEVVAFCGRFNPHQMIPCKGSSVYGDPVANYHRTTKGKNVGTWLCHIGTDSAKETWFSRFKLEPTLNGEPQANYLHLPAADWCSEHWVKQATNAVKVLKQSGRRRQWVFDMRNSGEGDEALDCLVGNLAMERLARQMFGLDLEQIAKSMAQAAGKGTTNPRPKRRSKAGKVTGGL